MNKIYRYLITITLIGSLLFVLTLPVSAVNVSIFDLQGGVRQLGMGGAFTGLADDGYALYYNPAGFAYLDGMSVSSFYSSELGLYGTSEIHFSNKYYGIGLNWLNVGNIQGYDSSGNPTETINYGNFGFTAGFGISWSELTKLSRFISTVPIEFSLGGRLKYYSVSATKEASGSGWAIDQSMLFDLGDVGVIKQAKMGLSFNNILSSANYANNYSENWGIGIRAGGSFVMQDITAAFDIELLRKTSTHLGLEFAPLNQLKIRAGAMLRSVGLSFTAGLGYSYQSLIFDYAYVTHPVAGGTHRLALSIDLGSLNLSGLFAPLNRLF